MSTQTISIQAEFPLDGFEKLNDILKEIKDILKDMIQPLKDLRDVLSQTIKPTVDTSGIETAQTALDGLSVVLGAISAILAVIALATGDGEVAAAIVGIVSAVAALASWLVSLDWGAIGEGFNAFFNGIGEGAAAA